MSELRARPGGGEREIVVDGRTIGLTNLDRVLYPEAGFQKRDLVSYMLAIADAMIPEIVDRPLTVGRFPSGVDGRGFAQAEVPGRPDWIAAMPLALANGQVKAFTVVRDRAALVWLAQMGTIEIHAFPGLPHDLERTRTVLFDLDPGAPAGILEAAEVALLVRDALAARGLACRAKTSGSLGIHVMADLDAPVAIAEARALAAAVAREAASARPDRVVVAMDRAARAGRVLVDVRQNAARLTTVVPYSLRSTPRPLVSTPVTWDEVALAVDAADASALVFSASDVLRRIGATPA